MLFHCNKSRCHYARTVDTQNAKRSKRPSKKQDIKRCPFTVTFSVFWSSQLNKLLNRLTMHYLDQVLLQDVINLADGQNKLKAHTLWQNICTFYCTSVWTKRQNYSLPYFRNRMHMGMESFLMKEKVFKELPKVLTDGIAIFVILSHYEIASGDPR